ncbi:hypothetical protein PYK79_03590 [Streptomyces sp. ID05-04B]|uniref:hypothetical protein n=1 Tax=Streptomyces sp. ID05-04B TaxID=3028661 RepID=UPI0029C1F6D5|nr:hypothetical protein [Streptomyces sp. ID05-04B]MDX5562725.1 hypothetical protein [Streptomyces sp. ID05-04B]MDX5562784.1 hypothetical protein [Streptomyces sp. ID05-04B]
MTPHFQEWLSRLERCEPNAMHCTLVAPTKIPSLFHPCVTEDKNSPTAISGSGCTCRRAFYDPTADPADPAGAAGKAWRRLGRDEWRTLGEALDNPDGDRLYAVQWEQARQRQAEREAAQREAQRPVCARCGAKFTDDRQDSIRWHSWRSEGDDLCGPCAQEDADHAEAERVARRQAEEAAAREAAEAEAKKNRRLLGRRRRDRPDRAAARTEG